MDEHNIMDSESAKILKKFDDDLILQEVIKRLYKYDTAAVRAKKSFRTGRRMVLVVVTAGTLAALSASYFSEVQTWQYSMGFLAIVLPALAGALINDIQSFSKPTSWLASRVVTERIRSQIYLYLMGAGVNYGEEVEAHLRDNKLNEQTREEQLLIGTTESSLNDVTDTSRNAKQTEAIQKYQERLKVWRELFDKCQTDDADLLMTSYIDHRVQYQIGWYDRTSSTHIESIKFLNRVSSGILFAGAIIPPLVFLVGADVAWISVIAVTNIISFSFSTWASVESFGRTVGIYRVARNDLQFLSNQWQANKNDPQYTDKTERLKLAKSIVTKIENKLEWEREEWYKATIQSIQSVDEDFFAAVEELQSSDKFKSSGYDDPDKNGSLTSSGQQSETNSGDAQTEEDV